MAFNFLRGETTIRKIVYETCLVIWEELKETYMPTPQERDWQNSAQQYKNLWQMPNCIGNIDGKHIRISRPKNSGSAFINYNNYFSIVLLAVVDAESLFTIVSIGDFGRNSDGGVFRNSPFGQMLKNGSLKIPPPVALPGETLPFPHYFVADEAFPLQEHIMRPYPGKGISNEKKIFNNRLSRARKTVECAFGRLASKFRVLYTRMCVDPDNAQLIVQAACIFHNFIHKSEKGQQVDASDETPNFADSFQPLSKRRGSSQANFNRDRLMVHFLKTENAIEGQNRYCT